MTPVPRTSNGLTPPYPFVSVIMPIRNEATLIARCLDAVLLQDYPPDCLEVIVVDGMSEDGTRQVVLHRNDGHGQGTEQTRQRLTLLDNPARVVPAALNIGLRAAHGEILIRVDGHCEVPPDYVRRCVEALDHTGADCVGGSILTVGDTWIAQAIAVAQSSSFGIGGVAFRTGRAHPGFVDTVAFGAYRRRVFERIGGFDERLVRHQDYEFNLRLRQAGGKIFYTPSINSRYHSRTTFRRLARQYFEYGFWKARVVRENRAALSLRHLAPCFFSLTVLLGALLALAFPWARPAYAALWAIYLLAALGAALHASSRAGWRHLPLLPLAFAIIHLCWGFGFWWGAIFPNSTPGRHNCSDAQTALEYERN